MEDEIFILIKIYLFNLDLQNCIFLTQAHADSNHHEKYIKTEKCYLINKEWMDEFKKYYLYDELYNYLNKKEIKKKLEIDNDKRSINKNNYNEINANKIFVEIKNNADFFKKYYEKEHKLIDG